MQKPQKLTSLKTCLAALLALTLTISSVPVMAADLKRNDPYYSKQLDTFGDDSPYSIHAEKSWDFYQSSNQEVIVAVIDTGVDITHEDLTRNIWTNTSEIAGNGIDDDGNGYIDDVHGWNFYNNTPNLCSYDKDGLANSSDSDNHGTHVAGIIAAKADNEIGIAGIASNINIKIMPLKVTGGANGTGKTSSLIKAIQYASLNGASICNISLNSFNYSEELFLTMQQSNMLFVCSAGNNKQGGINIDTVKTYPAAFQLPNVLSVAAVDTTGNLASYSNYGVNSIELAAPGSKIYSTLVGNSYGRFTGTSMATPFVSGSAAIIASMKQNFYPSEIRHILIDSVSPSTSLSDKVSSGGLLNTASAVLLGQSMLHEVDKTAPSLVVSYKKSTGLTTLSVTDQESGIKALRYQSGKRKAVYFKGGKTGKEVSSLKLSLPKGTYTFYAVDHEGNEIVKIIQINN